MPEGPHMYQPPRIRPDYTTYRSPHAPQYKIQPNFHGINIQRVTRFAFASALFAGVAGVGGAFFISDVPRFRIDIMQKLPIIGSWYVKETPPEDNPF